jgi:hypothetical protein
MLEGWRVLTTSSPSHYRKGGREGREGREEALLWKEGTEGQLSKSPI